jgi:hypothetical protein
MIHLRLLGQSNQQTFPQDAGVYFQRFMLPQSASDASFCNFFGPV